VTRRNSSLFLETSPIEAGKRYLAERGWTVGKHAA
jgi:hypothetical protein